MWLSLDKDDRNKKVNRRNGTLDPLMKVELNFLISISAVFFSCFEMPCRCLHFDQCLLTARLCARLDFGITMD